MKKAKTTQNGDVSYLRAKSQVCLYTDNTALYFMAFDSYIP